MLKNTKELKTIALLGNKWSKSTILLIPLFPFGARLGLI